MNRTRVQMQPKTISAPVSAFISHPLELTLGVWFSMVGFGLVLSGFSLTVSKVQTLPSFLVGAWALALLLSGPLLFIGILWKGDGLQARALERAGLYLAISAWASYAMTLLAVAPRLTIMPVGQSLVLAVGLTLRAVALVRVDRTVQHIASVAADDDTSGR